MALSQSGTSRARVTSLRILYLAVVVKTATDLSFPTAGTCGGKRQSKTNKILEVSGQSETAYATRNVHDSITCFEN